MLVEKTKNKIKCDSNGCNKIADYSIVNKKFVFDGSIYLCSSCLNELFSEISKFVVPKNVKPIYKRGGKSE